VFIVCLASGGAFELKATTGEYPNGERYGEAPLKGEHDGPHKHRSAQSGDQPSQHDKPML